MILFIQIQFSSPCLASFLIHLRAISFLRKNLPAVCQWSRTESFALQSSLSWIPTLLSMWQFPATWCDISFQAYRHVGNFGNILRKKSWTRTVHFEKFFYALNLETAFSVKSVPFMRVASFKPLKDSDCKSRVLKIIDFFYKHSDNKCELKYFLKIQNFLWISIDIMFLFRRKESLAWSDICADDNRSLTWLSNFTLSLNSNCLR